jgi:hypothetical protein
MSDISYNQQLWEHNAEKYSVKIHEYVEKGVVDEEFWGKTFWEGLLPVGRHYGGFSECKYTTSLGDTISFDDRLNFIINDKIAEDI